MSKTRHCHQPVLMLQIHQRQLYRGGGQVYGWTEKKEKCVAAVGVGIGLEFEGQMNVMEKFRVKGEMTMSGKVVDDEGGGGDDDRVYEHESSLLLLFRHLRRSRPYLA